jgi:DNA-binding beta-propeller fold protein YncE
LSIRVCVAVGALSFAACITTNPSDPSQSASTLALSRDDALLYAVDTDNAVLAVIDTKSETKLAEVKVGAGAAKVVVGPDDTIYVSNRFEHSVSVIVRGEWTEARRFEAGLEPVGLALSSNGSTLFVVSAVAPDTARHGSLHAIDTATGTERWQTTLGEEPRSIALTDEGHAVVTLLKQGDLQFVDLAARTVGHTGTDAYGQLNATAHGQDFAGTDTVHPRAAEAVAVTPDRAQVFALANLSRESGASGWGGCAARLSSAAAALQFYPNGTSHVDDLLACNAPDGRMPTVLSDGSDVFSQTRTVIQGPAAIAIDRTGAFSYIAAQQSNNVVINHTAGAAGAFGNATVGVVAVGAGPNGIAITRAGTALYVLNAFDHTVSVLKDDGSGGIKKTNDITIAGEVLSADAVQGRKHFFDATDVQMVGNSQGAACATCHIDNGREDGHVWVFPEGKRQTMSLTGGRLEGTAPFHWDGAFDDLPTLMDHTTVDRMGGSGPNALVEQQIIAYLKTLPAPINPKQLAPTEAAVRGAAVFQRAQCGSCHLGAKLTNNQFAHVGTDEPCFPSGPNVPSLLGVARTAPYLHDGRAASLEERIRQGQADNVHGVTADLSNQDVADLVEYLETL